jgi:hypothetical protein
MFYGIFSKAHTLRLLAASSSEMLVATYGRFKFASKNTVGLILLV